MLRRSGEGATHSQLPRLGLIYRETNPEWDGGTGAALGPVLGFGPKIPQWLWGLTGAGRARVLEIEAWRAAKGL